MSSAFNIPDGWREVVESLVRHIEVNECQHEDTCRGGAIWTICRDCGKKWADDRGGFKPYVRPAVLLAADKLLAAAPTPPVDAVPGEPKINAAGDWRPVRDALESAYARLGRTRGADGYPQADWNLAVLMYEAAAAKRDTTPCIHCTRRIAWPDAFRCLDCKGVLCERCAPEHFGPKHSDRAAAAHPSVPANAVSTSGFIQTVQPDPKKIKWDEQNEQRGAIYREANHG